MSTVVKPLTYEDLCQMPDDGRQYELIEGEIVVSPSPTFWHQIVSRRITVVLLRSIVEPGLGQIVYAPLDLRLPGGSIVQPDHVVFLRGNDPPPLDLPVDNVPDLVVEIVSPSSGTRDRGVKKRLYAAAGVAEYWLIDPFARTVTIHADPSDGSNQIETESRDVARSVRIAGLEVDVADLFTGLSLSS